MPVRHSLGAATAPPSLPGRGLRSTLRPGRSHRYTYPCGPMPAGAAHRPGICRYLDGIPMKTIIGQFDDVPRAQQAIDALLHRKYDKADISYIASDISGADTDAPSGSVSAALGLLTGLGAFAIPGIGPLLAAGPLAVGLAGTATSATEEDEYGLAGPLLATGVPRAAARALRERLGRGGALVLMRAHEAVVDNIIAVLSSSGAVEVDLYQRDPDS